MVNTRPVRVARRRWIERQERKERHMGFLDKVKEQAATATAAAKDAAQKGQAKLDTIQAKRAADAILRDLGAVVYGQRSGRGTAQSDADIERLTGALAAHEQAHGPIDLGLESDAASGAGSTGGAAAAAPGGAGAAGDASPPAPPPSGQSI
jgi:hypothetical protein